MRWERLQKEEAARIASDWENDTDFDSLLEYWEGGMRNDLPTLELKELRGYIVSAYEETFGDDVTGVNSYSKNLDFALKLYDFTVNRFGMTSADASDDDIWRYIQMKMVPHIVYRRWSEANGKRINDERFWGNTRRMWMKSLWWYIHLSLQDDSLEKTRQTLLNNNADDISQILDRPGTGYRVELYRAIMRRYGKCPDHSGSLLRNVLKLNVVRCVTAEPLLFEGGVDEYVDELFRYFDR